MRPRDPALAFGGRIPTANTSPHRGTRALRPRAQVFPAGYFDVTTASRFPVPSGRVLANGVSPWIRTSTGEHMTPRIQVPRKRRRPEIAPLSLLHLGSAGDAAA